MARLIRYILLMISLSVFSVSLLFMLNAWEYQDKDPEIKTLMHQQVSAAELDRQVGQAINEDRLEDAKMYLSIAREYGYPMHYDYYESHIRKRDTDARKLKRDLVHFAEGFATGKSGEGIGVAGAIAADLTVIGDARDLYKQYERHQAGQPVNQLVVGLAGVGVGLTLVTFGSAGVAIPAKAGTSVLKVASKAKRITPGFSQVLQKQLGAAFNWKRFVANYKPTDTLKDVTKSVGKAFNPRGLGPLKQTTTQMTNIQKATSVKDTLYMLRFVDNTQDLNKLSRFATKHGHQARGLLILLGKSAVRTVRIIKKSGQLLLSGLSAMISFMFSILFLFGGQKRGAVVPAA